MEHAGTKISAYCCEMQFDMEDGLLWVWSRTYICLNHIIFVFDIVLYFTTL